MSRPALALRSLPGFLALLAMVAGPASPAAAQSLWMQRDGNHTVLLEMLRPNIEDVDSKVLSGVFFLSGRTRLSSGTSLVGELPYLRHASSFLGTDFNGFEIMVETSSNTIGNPYLGIEAPLGGPAFVEVGFRPPLASDEEGDAVFAAILTDVTRVGGFLPDYASFQAAINLREVTESKIAYRARLSPMLAISTESSGEDPELFALYSFQIGYHGPAARVGAGMSGQTLITEDSGNLGGRSRNHLEIHADFLPGAIRPGLDLQLPIGFEASVVPIVVGASISWSR